MAETIIRLLSSPSAPSLIYLHHPHHFSTSAIPDLPGQCLVAQLDTIEHHTPRLFYSGVINKLDPHEEGEINTWDGFSRRLREVWMKSKGKRKADVSEDGVGRQVVLIITKAERLRTVLGGGWAVITRLAELVSTAKTARTTH